MMQEGASFIVIMALRYVGTIAFEGVEIVCGNLKTVEASKRTALLILEALLQGPPPELPEKGGYGMIVPGGGGRMGH